MAGRTMNNPFFATLRNLWGALLLATVPLMLTACGGAAEPPPLAGAELGGPFTLTDQDGKKVSDRDFAGRYRLIYFGYTFCPDICPVDVQNIMKGMKDLAKKDPELAAKIQPIFISIDPARDTPAALKTYTNAFPGLIALTGSEAEIATIAKSFAIYYKKIPPKQDAKDTRSPAQFEADEKNNYLMDHSRMATLFGPDGRPLALITQDKGAGPLVADLERWAR